MNSNLTNCLFLFLTSCNANANAIPEEKTDTYSPSTKKENASRASSVVRLDLYNLAEWKKLSNQDSDLSFIPPNSLMKQKETLTTLMSKSGKKDIMKPTNNKTIHTLR